MTVLKIYVTSCQGSLLTDTGSLVDAIKTEDVDKNFSRGKRMFDFSNYSATSKYYDDSKKLVRKWLVRSGSNKHVVETGGVAVNRFVGSKRKKCWFLVDDSSEHKKATDLNKTVVAAISHGEYKDVLLNEKCLRYSMN